jgi:hypothetical protein
MRQFAEPVPERGPFDPFDQVDDPGDATGFHLFALALSKVNAPLLSLPAVLVKCSFLIGPRRARRGRDAASRLDGTDLSYRAQSVLRN